ncbi:molybdopterin-guanine dinucleotide biosynthesis protein MobB [Tumebacillus sp. BK434]|uniref:molybdopterin-guanine dinucleotide biosynthesis protein B n=1 Tax=Tumebacillus sp. BK434 TaxID=2512169 RepID=UPI00104B24ED|nr:molybdopterin-guanine dinucleotide biosynthesis protein B [Tumebacillus sp. BK434]TCP52389.1 molybdopterin-guanine dinucleotide biosynthesis protein MobB [Tumebacillus sp. BK434]
MKAVAVVGYKNTGKTTLVARLVAAFKADGLRVGTLKHEAGGHDIPGDTPHSDTWQHRAAGADATLLVSPTQAVQREYYASEPPLEHFLAELADLDLVLVEGWKSSDLPKIVLVSGGKIERLTNVIALAGNCKDSSIAVGQEQVYDREDIEALVQLIKEHVLHE